MKTLSSLTAILFGVTLAVPAQALDFTTTAYATLTFSGIQTELFQPVGDARNTVLNHQGDGFFFENFPITLPGTGSAQSSLALTQVFTSASLEGYGVALANAYNEVSVIAKEIGWSTVTVNYRLEESGTVPLGSSLHATSHIFYQSNFNVTGEFESLKPEVETIVTNGPSRDIMRITTGAFSRSTFFDAIDSRNHISLYAYSQVSSVPLPDMLWPTLIGMIGLAGFVAWRRKHAA